MQRLRLLLASVAHFCVDSYATMLAPLLPLLMTRLGLGIAGAGFLGTLVTLCSITQPLLGLWGDHMQRRRLVLGGMAMTAVFTPLMGIAPSYWVLVGILWLGGLGVTPLWVRPFAEAVGLEWLSLVSLPGLLVLILVWRFLPLDNPQAAAREAGGTAPAGDGVRRGLILITVVVILRSVTGLCFGIFLAVLAGERGLSPEQGDRWLAIYNISGVVGALLFGYLSDRLGKRPLVCFSLLAASPALFFFLQAEGFTAYLLLGVGGGFLLASNSILVALAQELAPGRSGLASSLPLGFSWGVASLALGPTGYIADRVGLSLTLEWLALLPLVTAVAALFLPDPSRQR